MLAQMVHDALIAAGKDSAHTVYPESRVNSQDESYPGPHGSPGVNG